VSSGQLDPIDASLAPLAQSIGRAVLGAAALERVLLVDIARRQAERDGLREDFSDELSRLERRPAGTLLGRLRELGIAPELASDIGDVIRRRNDLVHHFMEDASFVAAFSGGDLAPLIERVDALAGDCQKVINELVPRTFGELARALNVDLAEVFSALHAVDLDGVDDDHLRSQIAVVQAMPVEQVNELLRGLDRDKPG
jgi:hypothetical protein